MGVFCLAAFGCSPSDGEGQDTRNNTSDADVAANGVSDATGKQDTIPEPRSGSDTAQTLRSADSHMHGGATLALALDGDILSVELESPLYNLVGFERAPDTDAQRTEVEQAERKLASPENLIAFNPEAGCRPDAIAPISLFADGGHDGDHKADHGDDHRHDDHDSDQDDDEHDESTHRDALVTYTFTCTDPSALRRANVDLLNAFPLMEEVDVVYLGTSTQKSFELSGSQTTLDLRP